MPPVVIFAMFSGLSVAAGLRFPLLENWRRAWMFRSGIRVRTHSRESASGFRNGEYCWCSMMCPMAFPSPLPVVDGLPCW